MNVNAFNVNGAANGRIVRVQFVVHVANMNESVPVHVVILPVNAPIVKAEFSHRIS
jgi:hypothetical protein